jgi:hypothetical protein
MNEALKSAVFESLNVAVDENGQEEMLGWSVAMIMGDMLSYDPTLEEFPDLDTGELCLHIKSWLESRGVKFPE